MDDSVTVYNSFDIIGNIAITKVPEPTSEKMCLIAEKIKRRHKNVKAVFAQSSAVAGDYRLRKLVCLSGEDKTYTVHKESGCAFAVDVERCYFSPRLSGERQRIARLVCSDEVVVNMFAGVGCFSILIAKQVPSIRVYSIDLNHIACQLMEENVRLNHLHGRVVPLWGDANSIIRDHLQGCADRVLMPLPEKALEYLPAAVYALKPTGGWLHIHLFKHASKYEDSAEKARATTTEALNALGKSFEVTFVRVVRSIGPRWYHLVSDVHIFR